MRKKKKNLCWGFRKVMYQPCHLHLSFQVCPRSGFGEMFWSRLFCSNMIFCKNSENGDTSLPRVLLHLPFLADLYSFLRNAAKFLRRDLKWIDKFELNGWAKVVTLPLGEAKSQWTTKKVVILADIIRSDFYKWSFHQVNKQPFWFPNIKS